MDLISKVKNKLLDWNISNKDGIVVAVSGGVDSMTLLHCLHSKSQKIHVVHINYHLRISDSDEDQSLIEDYCQKNEIGYSIFHADPKEMESNLQEKAREIRYGNFEQVLNEIGFKYIATAHHADDALETFLINFSRGSGLRGLTGIQEIHGNIIRPFIDADRNEILAFAKSNNIPWREDNSNNTTKYLRNKIRHEITPKLKSLEKRSEKAIHLSMNNLKKDQALMNEFVGKTSANSTYEKNGLVFLDLMHWRTFEEKETLLFHLLAPYGSFNIEQVCEAIDSQPGKQFQSKTHTLWIDRGQLILENRHSKPPQEPIKISQDLIEINSPMPVAFNMVSQEDYQQANFQDNTAWLDFDKLKFPLTLRLWKHGDRFKPLGMKGNKKVSDYLIDKKVPLPLKNRTLVLESDGKIVWLIGYRIDERFKVENKTKIVYLAKLL